MKKFEEEIIERIGEKRFDHTKRVSDCAVEIARIYGVDEKKAKLAGFFHDCAKYKDLEIIKEMAAKYGLELNEDMTKAPQIIHAHLGAIFAQKMYGIDDEDILNAIKYHTTGREKMSDLEKIIFLADYIEPKRNFVGVEDIRNLVKIDLDKAMLRSLDMNIEHLIETNTYIAIDTLRARNYILEMENGKIF